MKIVVNGVVYNIVPGASIEGAHFANCELYRAHLDDK